MVIGLIVLGIILLILGCNISPSSFQIQVGTSILEFSDDNIVYKAIVLDRRG